MSKERRNTDIQQVFIDHYCKSEQNKVSNLHVVERFNQHLPDGFIKELNPHITFPKYNGWSNSATWCIYMEITNNQTLYRLVMAHKGKMTIDDLKDITSHIKVESWCEGEINYAELLEELQ